MSRSVSAGALSVFIATLLLVGTCAVSSPATQAIAAVLPPVSVDCTFGGETPIVSGTVGDTVSITLSGPCSFTLSGDSGVAEWTDGAGQDPLTVSAGGAVFEFTLMTLGSLRLVDTGGMYGSTEIRVIVTDLGSYNCSAGPDASRSFGGVVNSEFTVFLIGSCAISSTVPGGYSWVDDAANANPALITNRVATVTLALSGSANWLAASPNVPISGGILTVATTASGGSTPGPNGDDSAAIPASMTVAVPQSAGQCPAGWQRGGWEEWAQAPVCFLTSTFVSGRWSAGTYADALRVLEIWNREGSKA
jgi:hypothetical protein